jgi:dTMP kinase
MSARGRLITIEGIDGAGKTTLAAGLLEALRERGLEVELLREPGGVELSERLRELVKDPQLSVGARAEALIYAAARAQLVSEAVVPRLERGTWVLLDRFVDSSLAYQGSGRELGMDAIAELNRFATGGLAPDRTLLLVLAPDAARARTVQRPGTPDRLEREDQAFFDRVLEGYEEIARRNPGRIRRVPAEGAAADVLAAALIALGGLV